MHKLEIFFLGWQMKFQNARTETQDLQVAHKRPLLTSYISCCHGI